MKISDSMVDAALAVAPGLDRTVVIAILQAGLLEASTQQLSALCLGVARVVAVVDTPRHASHRALLRAAGEDAEHAA